MTADTVDREALGLAPPEAAVKGIYKHLFYSFPFSFFFFFINFTLTYFFHSFFNSLFNFFLFILNFRFGNFFFYFCFFYNVKYFPASVFFL